MTVFHHPGNETLVRHAGGTLGPGPSVVVDAHVLGCAQCRAALRKFEAVGGALLEDIAPIAPPTDGLARALASIERPVALSRPAHREPVRPPLPEGFDLPVSVRDLDFGRWRWIAPGIHVSRAEGAWARAADLKLMRVGAGKRLLRHTHEGVEWTCVLAGSFGDGRTRYAPGDFSELDHSVDHEPVIDGDSDCICLVAMDGRLKPHGLIGRLYQMVVDA
jgi:putative transcriptional regulator